MTQELQEILRLQAILQPQREFKAVRELRGETEPHSILHVCKVCGWVGRYDELDRGEIGTFGYSEEPKCPRCHSSI